MVGSRWRSAYSNVARLAGEARRAGGGQAAVGGSRQAPTKNIHTKSTYHLPSLPAWLVLVVVAAVVVVAVVAVVSKVFGDACWGFSSRLFLGDNQ